MGPDTVLPADGLAGTAAANAPGLSVSRAVPTGWRLVVLVGSLTVYGPLCLDMYLPAFPDIGHDLHAGASQVQLTLTACLIGLAVGQLVFGPISDRLGRRRPLLTGLVAFAGSSLACAFAPSIYTLAGFRFFQGLGGGAGIVIARSIVRDLHSGDALVRFFSTLMLMTGLGPIVAPQIGSATLTFTTWRGVFLVLTGFGVVSMLTSWWRIPETLPPDLRVSGGVWSSLGSMLTVGRDRVFIGLALAAGLGVGGTFAYIAGSSFVLQKVYGLSPGTYGLVFAVNACGLIAGSQLNSRWTVRFGPSALMTAGLVTMAAAGAALVVIVASGALGLAGVVPAMVMFTGGFGFVGPSAMGLAMHRYPQSAGAAAAVLGSFQFIVGSVIAPLPGTGGTNDAMPMALLMLTLPLAALASRLALAGSHRALAVSPSP